MTDIFSIYMNGSVDVLGHYKLQQSQTILYTESTPSTCWRARYLSLRSFWKRNKAKIFKKNIEKIIYEKK